VAPIGLVVIADRPDADLWEPAEWSPPGTRALAAPRSAFDWDDLPDPHPAERPSVPTVTRTAVSPPAEESAPGTEGRALRLLRRGLIAQSVLGTGVAAFTLSTENYWPDTFHPLAWTSLGVLALALVLALLPDGRGVVVTRVLAGGVIVVALFGVVEHVLSNYGAGPADPEFGRVWLTMPALTRWGLAITKGVGDAPTLAPIALGQVALALLLVTVTGPRTRPLDEF
jgi:hypothetical protein